MAGAVPLNRLLTGITVLSTGLAPAVAPTLPGRLSSSAVLVLTLGVVAQLAATFVISRWHHQPHLGFAAAAAVSGGLVLAAPPWPNLIAVGAVAWTPVALGWAATRVFEYARSWYQLVVAVGSGAGYLVVVGSRAGAGWSWLTAVLAAAVPILGSITVMLGLRLRQARRDQLEALARQRVTAQREAERAERERLAVEIHDTLGRHLTLLVLRANTLTLMTDDPAVKLAGSQLSGFGSAALADLRRLVRLLHKPTDSAPGTRRASEADGALGPDSGRNSGPDSGPDPGPEMVARAARQLVAEARAAGQSVRLVVLGTDLLLPPVLVRTVDRVVQEGLTNARRHAPGSTVEVVVAVADDVEILVRNSAPEPGSRTEPGGGVGLTALRRRVELLGGHCESGAEPRGGYALLVTLPRVRALHG
ncbi:histidine kinase [Kribbella flavida DSM 17836]|uniref:histidine kinase n=1 Tax=Kribbella flavida (strain DSM 17836 / JCM 10339 / NBRC 14399) TaxID=479435 RepID=D2PVA8_KRIFD|nr:histidine kinase [Kribbella flavida]ADB33389.1 histidine kinase [Kribbella flavida DSM 17836]